jgi:hypothetical protein
MDNVILRLHGRAVRACVAFYTTRRIFAEESRLRYAGIPGLALVLSTVVVANAAPKNTWRVSSLERDAYRARIARALESGQFQDLELHVRELRQNKPHFSDSGPVIHEFYGGLKKVPIPALEKALARWQSEHPDSTSAKLAQAWLHRRKAWEARGGGYGSGVTEEAWKIYGDELRAEHRILRELMAGAVNDANVYVAALDNARSMGLSREEVLQALEKGLAIEPGDRELLVELTKYFQPRWYGLKGDKRTPEVIVDLATSRKSDVEYAWIATMTSTPSYGHGSRRA